MGKKKPTAGQRIIASAKQALAFAEGRKDHRCVVHSPVKPALDQSAKTLPSK